VGTLVHQEQWDPVHYDLEGPAWTPSASETAIQIKGRKEMYIVLRDSLDWEKHGAKVRAISDSKDPTKSFNAQALFRHLNSFFAVGTKDGDIQGVGKELRSATMESTGKNVVDFALHLEKLVKRLTGLGLAPNEHLEVVPIYLNGLLGKFRDIRNTIETKIEDSPDKLFTLQEVVEMVERKANKRGLLNVTSKGTTVDQNVTVAKGKKGKKGGNTNKDKGGDKNHENQVNQLKLQIKKLKEGAKPTKSTTQLQTSTGSTKDCTHGAKCWLTNCKFRHAAGHVPAANPRDSTCTTCGRAGHESRQCGKCFKCGSSDHMYNNCPERKRGEGQKVTQGLQMATIISPRNPDNPKRYPIFNNFSEVQPSTVKLVDDDNEDDKQA
jgi:hypothetical protein